MNKAHPKMKARDRYHLNLLKLDEEIKNESGKRKGNTAAKAIKKVGKKIAKTARIALEKIGGKTEKLD